MNKKWTKLAVTLLTTFSLTSLFAGCGTKNQTDVKNEKLTLKVATWAGATELKEFQEVVDKVNSQSKDYKLEIQSIPADYYKKIQTMISAKQAPDLIWLSQEYIPMYAKLGAIIDITDMAKNDTNANLDNYYEGVLNAAKYQDKLYGLPWINQPVVMYYNEDMFRKEGVELPNSNWTWDDFRKAAKKLTKDINGDGKVDQWGTVIDGWPPMHLWLWTYGGESVDAQGNIKIDSQESIKGLEMLSKILNEDKASPTKEQAQNMGNSDLFKTGKIAMFFGGAADDLEKSINGKFKVGMSEIPYATQRATFSWTASTVISSNTKNKEIAYKALVDLTNAIHQWKIVPPVKDGLNMVVKNRPEKEYAIDVIKKSAEYARGFNNQDKQAEIDTALWEQIYEPLINNKKTAEQAAKDAAEKIKLIIGK